MDGTPETRNLVDVRNSFTRLCQRRVGPLEVGACPGYADLFVAAMATQVQQPAVGGIKDACTNAYLFIQAFKGAEVSLKLSAATLPKSAKTGAASLLSETSELSTTDKLNLLGTGGPGPNTARGKQWSKWYGSRKGPTAAADMAAQAATSEADKPMPAQPALESWVQEGASATAWGPFVPRPCKETEYQSNPPCVHGSNAPRQAVTKYQIAPGCPDGSCGPVEISGDLFNYCAAQIGEITLGFAQTGSVVSQMTKDWCDWQSSVTSWVGQGEEYGHPDWNHHTCDAQASLIAFSLRDQLNDAGGMGSQSICKKIFLTIGLVHRVDSIVADAWEGSLRGAPSGGPVPPGPDDPGMKALMEQAAAYAGSVFETMRKDKKAYEDMANVKMDVSAWESQNGGQLSAPDPPPSLPDADDFDPNDTPALISTRTSRLRSWGGK